MGKRAGEKKTAWDVLWLVLSNPKIIVMILAAFGVSTAYHVPAARQYLPEIGEKIDPIVSNDVHPDVKLKIEQISKELTAIRADLKKAAGLIGSQNSRSEAKIEALTANVKKWHGD